MPTVIDPSTLVLVPRLREPPPTEEDRRRMRESSQRMEEDARLAREAGERLPPITENIWGIPED
jgi:hypothetical protein